MINLCLEDLLEFDFVFMFLFKLTLLKKGSLKTMALYPGDKHSINVIFFLSLNKQTP